MVLQVADAPIERAIDEASTSQPRRSERVSCPPERFIPGIDFVLLTDGGEPSCYKEAMLAKDRDSWELAMKSDIIALKRMVLGNWFRCQRIRKCYHANGYSSTSLHPVMLCLNIRLDW